MILFIFILLFFWYNVNGVIIQGLWKMIRDLNNGGYGRKKCSFIIVEGGIWKYLVIIWGLKFKRYIWYFYIVILLFK